MCDFIVVVTGYGLRVYCTCPDVSPELMPAQVNGWLRHHRQQIRITEDLKPRNDATISLGFDDPTT